MLKLLHYQENGENKGSQMGHTKKILKKKFDVIKKIQKKCFILLYFPRTHTKKEYLPLN